MNWETYLAEIHKLEQQHHDQHEDEEPQSPSCPHRDPIIVDDHSKVCQDCGAVLETFLVPDLFGGMMRPLKKKGYTRMRHMKEQMTKFMGFEPIKSIDLSLFPDDGCDIQTVRRIMRQSKLDLKYDVFVWLRKNNIKTRLRREDAMNWEAEFRKNRKAKSKDFLFEKVKNHPVYHVFADVLRRRTKKKKQPQSN